MNSRIKDKIKQIEQYLDELLDIFPASFEEYKSSLLIKAACERYVEKVIEASVDLSFIIIKFKNFDIPEDDADAFRILCEKKVIGKKLSENLKDAKGMRNIIVHEYSKINDKIVFDSINDKLEKDIIQFIDRIEFFIKKK